MVVTLRHCIPLKNVLQGFFSKGNGNHAFYIEPFTCFNGSLHSEMVLHINGECIRFYIEPKKGFCCCYDVKLVKLVTIKEPFFKMALDRTIYNPFLINL